MVVNYLKFTLFIIGMVVESLKFVVVVVFFFFEIIYMLQRDGNFCCHFLFQLFLCCNMVVIF